TFNAYLMEDRVNLSWITQREINNEYFMIERSKDRLNYRTIDTLEAAGNSMATIHYSVTDKKPLSGWAYYRLKQIDYNGDFSYSEIAPVYCPFDKRTENRQKSQGLYR